MQNFRVLAQKLWICTPIHFSAILGWSKMTVLDLRSNGRSKPNFDYRNGFLGVDYIGLDTSHDKIEDFTQNVRGGGGRRLT